MQLSPWVTASTLTMPLWLLASAAQADAARASADLRARVVALMDEGKIPGLAVAVLVEGEVVLTDAFGWADVESQRPMERTTVLNVGSVSKLVTSTAVLQLWEQGKLDLDVDVSRYLPFEVRHPAGERPITVRQLLTHTAGIQDGPSYGASYACGDPAVTLQDWLHGYLAPGGRFYSEDNFLKAAPGSTFEYSNVGYGLLGLVAERVAGRDFEQLTGERIFAPLGMTTTGWLLTSVERDRHATPYWLQGESAELDAEERALLTAPLPAEGGMVPFCLYSFYNYPDGLLRTTIEDLVSFVRATRPGVSAPSALLSQSTREQIFRDQTPGIETDGRVQGLGWRRTDVPGLGSLWGHGGADPGVRAHVLHRLEDGVTVLAMANRLVVEEFRPILELLFAAAAERLRNGR